MTGPWSARIEDERNTANVHLHALREVYWLIRHDEADNALHALDAYLIQHGVNPEDYASPVVLAQRVEENEA